MMDSSIAIARAINELNCSEEVKDVLRKVLSDEIGAKVAVTKSTYTTAIENWFESWSQSKKSEDSE